MRTSRRRTWLAIGLAAAAAMTAAPAGASVGDPIALGADGTAHFMWQQSGPYGFNQLHERALSGGGTLTDAQSVSSLYRNVDNPFVGADGAGNALFAWKHDEGPYSTLYTRRRGADGSLGPIQKLTPGGAYFHSIGLAVEPDGDALYVWVREGAYQVVQARRRAADGSLGPVLTVSYAAANAADPVAAVAPSGVATIAWLRRVTNDSLYIQARTLAADGTLGATQALTSANAWVTEPHVTVNEAGTAVVAWTLRPGDQTGPRVVQARARTAGGALSATQTLSTGSADFLRTAGDATGRTAFVWAEYDEPNSRFYAKGRVRLANGILQAPFDVTPEPVGDPVVAIDPSGNATYGWTAQGEIRTAKLRRRTLAGTLQPVRTLSEAEQQAGLSGVAVDSAGKATALYTLSPTGRSYARTVTPGGTVSPAKPVNGEE